MQLCDKTDTTIIVGARSSTLARVQVQEVLQELRQFHSYIRFSVHYTSTIGDKDQLTSLRSMDKTNFFTKEIDELVLEGKCRIGIHSAKDLPFPLPKGLALICLTKGINPADSLVLRPNETIDTLPPGAMIATSSIRREEMVKELRPDLSFCDIRGTIEQRLKKLETKEADGVVIAEAALIRLGLNHLNRISLPGPTAEGQGQLAVVSKENDLEMQQLFAEMDVRKIEVK